MKPREEWKLDAKHVGRRVLVFDRVDSTNTVVAGFAEDPARDGLAVLADAQTAGRGRLGRSWESARGAGVWISLLLFAPPALRRPALLTAWAAVSVCETIRQVANVQARIKWPNDVLVRGRKVCGILIEQRQAATVCGIGLNVAQPAEYFVQADLPYAASLAIFNPAVPSRDEVARNLLRQLDEEYGRLYEGDLATLLACWKWRLGLLGKQVTVECPGGPRRGRLRDLTWDAVELELTGGGLLRLRPEAVQHVLSEPEA